MFETGGLTVLELNSSPIVVRGTFGSSFEAMVLPLPKLVDVAVLWRARPRSVSVIPTSRMFKAAAGLIGSYSVESEQSLSGGDDAHNI